MSLFGTLSREPEPDPDDEVAALRRKLRDAESEIDRLRRALGSNHPLGYKSGLFG